ncbi:hypothetical protein HT136_21360 [Novosphingobium profundi]|uniref:hypothetical protein n=1 Tax=Novosphingobium profundi TaxID=1774954 RepID=UPI001BDA8CD8|nr:hypothetical protein [Novosphingobium profundi]MBT0670922.1 hypothetical protein [Novosphingobium profundi]
MKSPFLPLLAALALLPEAAGAATPLALTPEHLGAETARYDHGTPTVSLKLPQGTVEVRPLPVEDGRVAFSLAFFNEGERAVNFGTANVAVTRDGTPLAIPTSEQLERAAKDKARGAKIGTALFAGVVVGVASTASREGTVYRWHGDPHHGPGGPGYVEAIHWHDDTPGQVGAAMAVTGGAMAIRGIDRKLDYTLAQLGAQALETTTVDPGSSYGGMIVVPGAASGGSYAQLRLTVTIEGARYPFAFRLAPAGAAPAAPMPATQPAP